MSEKVDYYNDEGFDYFMSEKIDYYNDEGFDYFMSELTTIMITCFNYYTFVIIIHNLLIVMLFL